MPRVAKKSAKPRGKAKKNGLLEELPEDVALSAPVEESATPRSSEDLHPPTKAPQAPDGEEPAATLPADVKDGQTINISQLQAMSMAELNSMAKEMGIENFGTMKKHEVIFQILQKNAERSGILFAEGVLEILPEGFGFLRRTFTFRHPKSAGSICRPGMSSRARFARQRKRSGSSRS